MIHFFKKVLKRTNPREEGLW